MLGTTDTKEMLNRSVEDITNGFESIVHSVLEKVLLEGYKTPSILIVVPPVINEKIEFAKQFFKGGTAKGRSMGKRYKNLARRLECNFLDPTEFVIVDDCDGVYLAKEGHKVLAKMVHNKLVDIEACNSD